MAPRILILGGTGMLGHVLFGQLSGEENLEVYATVRSKEGLAQWFSQELVNKCLDNVCAFNFGSLIQAVSQVGPEVIINCIGIIKQSHLSKNPATAITVNALFPQQLALLCRAAKIRLIHISTDCVFSGDKGNYREGDPADAQDLYGRTKFLGEVDGSLCVTIRTSLIGHELRGKLGLVEWFLAQTEPVRGFTQAIFSGFPTVELASIIGKYFLPDPTLNGIFHVSSHPISKYDLLTMVAARYGKKIDIRPYGEVRLDRSLDSSVFREKTGYSPPSWPDLVEKMYRHYMSSVIYQKNGVKL